MVQVSIAHCGTRCKVKSAVMLIIIKKFTDLTVTSMTNSRDIYISNVHSPANDLTKSPSSTDNCSARARG